ncbi:MAG: hypothetical protein AB1646_07360 [Thermodesulfobacteriota bacterium]
MTDAFQCGGQDTYCPDEYHEIDPEDEFFLHPKSLSHHAEDQEKPASDDLTDWPVLNIHSPLRNAVGTIAKIADANLRKQAHDLLVKLQLVLNALEEARFDVGGLPSLGVAMVEDGSVLLEWASVNYRLGFSLEPNSEDSSWFLITSREFGGLNASGFLTNIRWTLVFPWLLWFIVCGC